MESKEKKKRLKETNIDKVYFYYYRNKNKEPRITVCLIKLQNGCCARGVSLCSHKDNPNKNIGKAIAYGRALNALNIPSIGWIIGDKLYPIKRMEAFDVFFDCLGTLQEKEFTRFKAIYPANLEMYEKRIIYGDQLCAS